MYFSRPTGEVSEPKSYSLTIKKSEPWGRTKESLLASCNGLYVTKKADITHTTYTYQDELKTRREVDQLTILRTTLGNSDTSSEPKSSDEYSENGLHQRLHQTMAEDGFSSPLLAELSKLQEFLKNEKALEFIEKTRALAFSKKTNGAGLISLIRTGSVMGIETGITGLKSGNLVARSEMFFKKN